MKGVLYFVGLLTILSCSRNGKETLELFDLEVTEDNSLLRLRERTDPGNNFSIGYEIEFDGRNNLSKVAHSYSDTIIGYANYYYKQQLIHCRQYIIVENKQYVNQYWNFDESGNIDRNLSNYYSIGTSGDTVLMESPWIITVSLDCPYFNDQIELVTGDFDDMYFLIDSASIMTTRSGNNINHQNFLFKAPGIYIIRGYISDYTLEEGVRKERRLYFEKEVLVVE